MVASASISSPRTAQISYADRAKESKPTILNALVAAAPSSKHLPGSSGSATVAETQRTSNPSKQLQFRPPANHVWGQSRSGSPSSQNGYKSQDEGSTKSHAILGNASMAKDLPANVWQIRKEQLLQVRSFPAPNLPTQASDSPPTLQEPQGSPNPLNGFASYSNHAVDPFIVHPFVPPPSMGDTEVWPEVGTSSRPKNTRTNKGLGNGGDIAGDLVAKKGEKPKWVPIPAIELQAAADAAGGRSQALSRNLTPYKHQQSTSVARSRAESTNPSMHSSRPPSTHPPSRVHSRTGSAQRSPKEFPGAKLPENVPADSRRSRENSDINIHGSGAGIGTDHRAGNYLVSGTPGHDTRYSPQNVSHVRVGAGSPRNELVGRHVGAGGSLWISSPSLDPSNQVTLPSHERQGSEVVQIPPKTAIARPPPPAESKALSGYREVEPASNLEPKLNGKAIVFGSDAEIHLHSSAIQKIKDRVDRTTTVPFAIGTPLAKVPNARRWLRTKPVVGGENGTSNDSDLKDTVDLPPSRWVFGTLQHSSAGNPPFLTQTTSDGSPTPSPTTLNQGGPDRSDDWEVKDFGFGFGPMSGTGRGPALIREEILARVAERDLEPYWERGPAHTPEHLPQDESRLEGDSRGRVFRGRRGGLSGYRDRGGYRGRGGQGFRRGFGPRNPSYQGHQTAQPHFVARSSNHYHSLHHPDSADTNYYLQPPVYSPYGVGYDVPYSPYPPLPLVQPPAPGPGPVSVLSFPLDYTRYYLLGQLEYYLSPQNMAQDFYLRQQMNPDGWIPISLLASFNRVRQFTMDVEMVQEVLSYSSVVEVSDDWVRMSGEQWKPFLLPIASSESAVEARTSDVDEVENPHLHVEDDGLVDEDEDEEEVEFVMG